MAERSNEQQSQLVEQLTVGFGAMLEQVEELARRNHDLRLQLEQVRQRVHKEVCSSHALTREAKDHRTRYDETI